MQLATRIGGSQLQQQHQHHQIHAATTRLNVIHRSSGAAARSTHCAGITRTKYTCNYIVRPEFRFAKVSSYCNGSHPRHTSSTTRHPYCCVIVLSVPRDWHYAPMMFANNAASAADAPPLVPVPSCAPSIVPAPAPKPAVTLVVLNTCACSRAAIAYTLAYSAWQRKTAEWSPGFQQLLSRLRTFDPSSCRARHRRDTDVSRTHTAGAYLRLLESHLLSQATLLEGLLS